MASLRELIVKISADSSDFQRGIAAAQKQAVAMSQKFEAAGAVLTRSLTLPIGALGALSLRSAAQFDSLERGLKAVSKTAGDAEAQMVRLRKVAELPGLGFREAIQGSINLQAAGLSAATAERALKAFGNALATVGKGRAELDGVVLALSQIQSKGKISAEEINQLAERLPQIRVAIRDAFGTADTEAIQKLGITSQQFIERVIQQFERLPAVTGGISNSFENLRDRAERSLASIGKALVPAAKAALDALDPLIEKAGQVADAFTKLPQPVQTATIALLGIAAAAGPISNIIKLVYDLRVAMLAAAATPLGTAIVASLTGTAVAAAGAKKGIEALTFGVAEAAKGTRAASAATETAAQVAGRSILGIGAAAGAAGTAAFLFFDKLNDYAVKTSTSDTAIKKLNATLQRTSDLAAGATFPTGKVADLARAVFAVGKESGDAAGKLALALGTLNVKGPQQLKTELQGLKDALDTVRAAYKRGEVDLRTLTEATQKYQDEVKKLASVPEPPKLTFAKQIGDAATKQAEADVLAFTTAAFDAEAQIKMLSRTISVDLNPVVDTLSAKLKGTFRDPISELLKLNATLVTTQAQIDQVNQTLTAATRSPVRNLQVPGTVATDVSLKTAGIVPYDQLRAQAQKAGDLYEQVNNEVKAGTRSAADAKKAYEAWTEAEARAAGITLERTKATGSAWKALGRQVSTVVTDLSRSLADVIFQGGKVKDIFRSIGIDIAKSITRYAIEGGINLLIESLGKLLLKVVDVGGTFAKIFGSAGEKVGKAAGSLGSTAASSGGGEEALAGGGGGGGGILGILSQVSTVLQYLNSRRMEQDIGRIEVTTRGMLNELSNLRSDEWARFNQTFLRQGEILNSVRGIYDGLSAIDFSGLRAAGAGGGIIINNAVFQVQGRNGPELLEDIARQLKLVSPGFNRG
jgi:tape measure domain-containing protein